MGPALEDYDIFTGTFAVRECADCLNGLVVEAGEHLVEVCDADLLDEPLSGGHGTSDERVKRRGRFTVRIAPVCTGVQLGASRTCTVQAVPPSR